LFMSFPPLDYTAVSSAVLFGVSIRHNN
jgi:hypothetical protein